MFHLMLFSLQVSLFTVEYMIPCRNAGRPFLNPLFWERLWRNLNCTQDLKSNKLCNGLLPTHVKWKPPPFSKIMSSKTFFSLCFAANVNTIPFSALNLNFFAQRRRLFEVLKRNIVYISYCNLIFTALRQVWVCAVLYHMVITTIVSFFYINSVFCRATVESN